MRGTCVGHRRPVSREPRDAHEVDRARLVFEAPRSDQQAWFVNHYGSDVNLGNVPPHEVVSLESLRLGLRSDTLATFHGIP